MPNTGPNNKNSDHYKNDGVDRGNFLMPLPVVFAIAALTVGTAVAVESGYIDFFAGGEKQDKKTTPTTTTTVPMPSVENYEHTLPNGAVLRCIIGAPTPAGSGEGIWQVTTRTRSPADAVPFEHEWQATIQRNIDKGLIQPPNLTTYEGNTYETLDACTETAAP